MQLEQDAGALEGKVSELTSITAMPGLRQHPASGAMSIAVADSLHNPLLSEQRNSLHGQPFPAGEQLPKND